MLIQLLANTLFPKKCYGCGALGTYVCSKCASALDIITQQRCLYCRRGSLHGITHATCVKKGGVDGFLGVYAYRGIVKKILHDAKYRLVKQALEELLIVSRDRGIYVLKPLISGQVEKNILVSVPLHINKERERGYNQAREIAQVLQDNSIPKLEHENIMERINVTRPQSTCQTKRERMDNIKSAFAIKKTEYVLFGKNIVIVDDIVTSGSTVLEIARVLKNEGVKKVYVFALAC